MQGNVYMAKQQSQQSDEPQQHTIQHHHPLRIRLLIALVLLLLLFLLIGTILSILSITNVIHVPWSLLAAVKIRQFDCGI